MKNLKLVCLASLLASGIAQASTHCDGFEIKVKNNLVDDLLVRKVQLNGADIQPSGIEKIDKQSEAVFTVNNSNAESTMTGEMVFNTLSLPTKEVRIKFELKNKALVCEHTDRTEDQTVPVEKTRVPGQVKYAIG